MQVKSNISLLPFNTFGIDVTARYYVEIKKKKDLQKLRESDYWEMDRFILGGGSNILLLDDLDGITAHIRRKGIKVVEEGESSIILRVGAGEVWHDFVMYCVGNGYGGLENLSLIPGSVGAAPMQNIGAYGEEQNACFHSLTAFDIENKVWRDFTSDECEFGYRNSIFKNLYKNKFIIWDVTYRLTKKDHRINTSYGAIQQKLHDHCIAEPTIKDVSEAVIEIRQSKLPDPAETGNSGSFFKNPIVPNTLFNKLKNEFEEMPYYTVDKKNTKIPAGWLIEQCGWKGKKVGRTGTYPRQALVLVNHGGASGKEVWNLAMEIQKSVELKFGIKLEPEVNLIS